MQRPGLLMLPEKLRHRVFSAEILLLCQLLSHALLRTWSKLPACFAAIIHWSLMPSKLAACSTEPPLSRLTEHSSLNSNPQIKA